MCECAVGMFKIDVLGIHLLVHQKAKDAPTWAVERNNIFTEARCCTSSVYRPCMCQQQLDGGASSPPLSHVLGQVVVACHGHQNCWGTEHLVEQKLSHRVMCFSLLARGIAQSVIDLSQEMMRCDGHTHDHNFSPLCSQVRRVSCLILGIANNQVAHITQGVALHNVCP